MKVRVRIVVCLALALGLLALSATASSAVTVLRPHWKLVGRYGANSETDWGSGTGTNAVLVGSRYVYIGDRLGSRGEGLAGTVRDELTGREWRVSRAGCQPAVIGGGWLDFNCNVTFNQWLYNLATRAWQQLAFGPPYSVDGIRPGGVAMVPAAIGAKWAQFSSLANLVPYGYAFENIQSGQWRLLKGYVAGGRTVPDLNSAKLAKSLCAPLEVGHADDFEVPGAVSFVAGRVLIANPFPTPLIDPNPPPTYLGSCGSAQRIVLPDNVETWTPVPQSAHAVLLGQTDPTVTGLLLPSLKRFSIPIEQFVSSHVGAGGTGEMLLSDRRLYLIISSPVDPRIGVLVSSSVQVWSAPAPQSPAGG